MVKTKLKYDKPSMRVLELKQKTQLLVGSNGETGLRNYDMHDEKEE